MQQHAIPVSYLPYKVYQTLTTLRALRMNMNVLYPFIVISFLNRCINPFIYASQYEVVRRTWTPLVEFLRRHFARKPSTVPRVEPLPASTPQLRYPAGQEQPIQ